MLNRMVTTVTHRSVNGHGLLGLVRKYLFELRADRDI